MKRQKLKRLVIWCLPILFVIFLVWGIYTYIVKPVDTMNTIDYVDLKNLSTLARHGEDISIYVDFGIDSSQKRFFVYDNRKDSMLSSSKCAHGSGRGSTESNPQFSNDYGSNCSSLGEYKLTMNSRSYNYNLPCIRLAGLSPTNSNAASRGILIHEAPNVADDISIGVPIPISPLISQGCFAISTKTFKLLQSLMDQKKTIYLYAVYNSPSL